MSVNKRTEQQKKLAIWQRQVERATYYDTVFLRMALRECQPSEIVELLHSVPSMPDEAMDKRESFFVRVARNANRFHDRKERDLLVAAYDYFAELAKEDMVVRQYIEVTITAVSRGYTAGLSVKREREGTSIDGFGSRRSARRLRKPYLWPRCLW